jgi:hypothetical protein
MSIPLLEVVLGLTLILVLKWIWRRKQDLQKLQKLGYSVPPVSFIGGNLIELFSLSRDLLFLKNLYFGRHFDIIVLTIFFHYFHPFFVRSPV